MRPFIVAVCALFVLLSLVVSLPSRAAEPPVTDCDRLTANPIDKQKVAPGVAAEFVNPQRAIPACQQALERYPDSPRLLYQLGRAFHNNNEPEKALPYYEKAAKQNYLRAISILAWMYEEGDGVGKDRDKARQLLEKTAALGDSASASNLAEMQIYTVAAKQDFRAARDNYRKAGEAGNAAGFSTLGALYQYGFGGPVDNAAAATYYAKAAEAGNISGMQRLGLLYEKGIGVPRDVAKAKELYRKAGGPGYSELPFFRIDAEMPVMATNGVQVDREGKRLYSLSPDNSLRVWDIPTKSLIRTIRLPSGPNPSPEYPCFSLSPDGRQLAIAASVPGPPFRSVLIYDLKREAVTRAIPFWLGSVHAMRYSPDGTRLAVGSFDGLTVFSVPDFSIVFQDDRYGLGQKGHSTIWGLDFGPSGRLATVSYDTELRLYSKNFKEIKGIWLEHRPRSVAFSPNGKWLAVGFWPGAGEDSKRTIGIDIYSAEPLRLEHRPDSTAPERDNFEFVTWSNDSAVLFAAGSARKHNDFFIRAWDAAGRGQPQDINVSDNTVTCLAPFGSSGVAYGSNRVLGILDERGRTVLRKTSPRFDNRAQEDRWMAVNDDGTRIQFGCEKCGDVRAEFSLGEEGLTLDPAPDATLRLPQLTAEGVVLDNWFHRSHPTLNGKPLNLGDEPNDRFHAACVAPDRKSFALGSTSSLSLYNAAGTLRWRHRAFGEAWSVNYSGNGKYVIASFGDGTIRWFRPEDGTELLALFPTTDCPLMPAWTGQGMAELPSTKGCRWVAWTPEGFFDHSRDGEKLIGFQVNRGQDKPADFVRMDQLYDLFYRPDLVRLKLAGGHDDEIRDAVLAMGDLSTLFNRNMPPEVAIQAPANTLTATEENFTLRVKAANKGGGIGKVVYFVNGTALAYEDARGRLPRETPAGTTETLEKSLALSPGNNTIQVVVYDAEGKVASKPVNITVTYAGKPIEKPTLHILSVGVNQYRDQALWLHYAVPDAKALVTELKSIAQGLYQNVDAVELYDDTVTADGIDKAFRAMAERAKPQDVVVVFFAGHGKSLDGKYYFLPYDFRYNDESSIRKTAITQETMQRWLANIKAQKSLLLLDTCDSGAFTNAAFAFRGLQEKTAIEKLSRATGRGIFAASMTDQPALEGIKGHGYFTYSLLAGIHDPHTPEGKEGLIGVKSLGEYIRTKVPELTYAKYKFEQVPQVLILNDFPLGRSATSQP